ncbi:L3 [Tursiops truncatus papillomavirus 5]|uniref:L3 n=1 Tax=Tursiops truncatus papillomavirus 5 TaxID=1144381 RepID=H6UYP5_PSPV|nr:L3 [Tursiops truncatus papillomavirus 5]
MGNSLIGHIGFRLPREKIMGYVGEMNFLSQWLIILETLILQLVLKTQKNNWTKVPFKQMLSKFTQGIWRNMSLISSFSSAKCHYSLKCWLKYIT